MSWKLSSTLIKLRKKHGDIFTIKVGSKTWVVLTDFNVIKSAFQKNVIEEHKRNLDPKNPKDFIDKYLIELEVQKDNPDYQYWGDDDLLLHIYDFFLAGSETTSSTIR
ncbi:hypothetical protein Anas_11608 [Armadillidium nasatum]|uniref:Uncharacterized protein n=1 Tax=Armadillidium nasatum TaxID=96803 RepID=A0A5N5T0K1_9CRUS|nr:hypothetical protein Anas_11608 [Armadillidium nasatum]